MDWAETEEVIEELERRGVKREAGSCPSFVADCLETIEEIGDGAREMFLSAGGEDLKLIPSLNSDAVWVDAIASWIESASPT